MKIREIMTEKLTAAFAPSYLAITDDSDRHIGHAGHDGKGESHFTVEMVSETFAGMSRVARQRAVYAALAQEMGQIHALALTLRTPEES